MKKVTLDTNCIIDLEEKRADYKYSGDLIQLNEEEKIILRVVAISASEKQKDQTYNNDFSKFMGKLKRIGLNDVKIILPMVYWGVSFLDHGLWNGEEMIQLEETIHNILFPDEKFVYEDFCNTKNIDYEWPPVNEKNRKWINIKCDVQMMWSHIYHQGDIFVSSDRNFHKKSKKVL